MSFTKFNHLHLHATDAQSWPLEIPALPELAAKGAYDQSQIWTTADLEEVQEYGVFRGVEVYVEVDMPGHTASIFVPTLTSLPHTTNSLGERTLKNRPPGNYGLTLLTSVSF